MSLQTEFKNVSRNFADFDVIVKQNDAVEWEHVNSCQMNTNCAKQFRVHKMSDSCAKWHFDK